MNSVTKIFSSRLRQLRGGKSQEEVSKGIGISRGALSYYEKGERNPDINVLHSIAKYYNVSADYLIGLSDTPSLSFDIKSISDNIGLDEISIQILKSKTKGSKETLTTDNEEYATEKIIQDYLFLQAINVLIGYGAIDDIAIYLFTDFTHCTNYYDDDENYHPISGLELFDCHFQISYRGDNYDFFSESVLLAIQKNLIHIRNYFREAIVQALPLSEDDNNKYTHAVMQNNAESIKNFFDSVKHSL